MKEYSISLPCGYYHSKCPASSNFLLRRVIDFSYWWATFHTFPLLLPYTRLLMCLKDMLFGKYMYICPYVYRPSLSCRKSGNLEGYHLTTVLSNGTHGADSIYCCCLITLCVFGLPSGAIKYKNLSWLLLSLHQMQLVIMTREPGASRG